MSARLSVPHNSIRSRVYRTKGMTRLVMEPEQREAVEEIAGSIFADMASTAHPFHACLAAVYLSGMQHAEALRSTQA